MAAGSLRTRLRHPDKAIRQAAEKELNKLLEAFHDSAVYLRKRIENEGWQWSDNYLREHARCTTGASFTNSVSPLILKQFFKRYPQFIKFSKKRKRSSNGTA
jgi:hypothetical protein